MPCPIDRRITPTSRRRQISAAGLALCLAGTALAVSTLAAPHHRPISDDTGTFAVALTAPTTADRGDPLPIVVSVRSLAAAPQAIALRVEVEPGLTIAQHQVTATSAIGAVELGAQVSESAAGRQAIVLRDRLAAHEKRSYSFAAEVATTEASTAEIAARVLAIGKNGRPDLLNPAEDFVSIALTDAAAGDFNAPRDAVVDLLPEAGTRVASALELVSRDHAAAVTDPFNPPTRSRVRSSRSLAAPRQNARDRAGELLPQPPLGSPATSR
ncbi:MAG: hypothetical protein HYV63_17745 [Candidatus Schekmanbacteria bacterium]|nr:hypothetical protein [Candidatus Schekmanbacteria bacterium]